MAATGFSVLCAKWRYAGLQEVTKVLNLNLILQNGLYGPFYDGTKSSFLLWYVLLKYYFILLVKSPLALVLTVLYFFFFFDSKLSTFYSVKIHHIFSNIQNRNHLFKSLISVELLLSSICFENFQFEFNFYSWKMETGCL